MTVFDADAYQAGFAVIAVKIKGAVHAIQGTLTEKRIQKIDEAEREFDKGSGLTGAAKLLATYLGIGEKDIDSLDIRTVTESIRHVKRELQAQLNGKSGNPTGGGAKRSRKS